MLAALSTPDVIVAIVCVLAAVRGAFKGFAWTLVRFVGLVAAIAAAIFWYEAAGVWIGEKVSFIPDALTNIVAFAGILVVVWLISAYFAWIVRGAVKRVNLGGIDRPLGFVAGAAKGLLFMTLVTLLVGHFAPKEWTRDQLKDSVIAPYMRQVVEIVEPILPEEVRSNWGHILDALDDIVAPPTTN